MRNTDIIPTTSRLEQVSSCAVCGANGSEPPRCLCSQTTAVVSSGSAYSRRGCAGGTSRHLSSAITDLTAEHEDHDRLVVSTPSSAPKLLLTVEEAAQRLSVGRTLLYDLVMRQQIVSVKIGRARRIPVIALQEFVERKLDEWAPHGGSLDRPEWGTKEVRV